MSNEKLIPSDVNPEELKQLYDKLKDEYFDNFIFDIPSVYEGFTYKVFGESLVVISFDDSVVVNGKLTIPVVFDSVDFRNELGVNILVGNRSVKEIDLGRITKVRERMFKSCTNLESVTGNFVMELGANAFADCVTLREVSFPRLVYVGESSFEGDINLREVVLPEAKVVESRAFNKCSNLVKADLHGVRFMPNNYSSNSKVPEAVFGECERLEEVDVSGAFVLGPNMFYGCASLKELRIPLARVLYEQALAGCLQLETLYLDNMSGFKEKSLLYCDCLKYINYYGPRERWNEILIEDMTELDVIKKAQVTLDYKDPE